MSVQLKSFFNIRSKLVRLGIIILHSLQMRVLLENTTFLLNKIAGIIRVADIIQGRALYEEIRYFSKNCSLRNSGYKQEEKKCLINL